MSDFWVKKMKRHFHVMDVNGDGVITKENFGMFVERFCDKENPDPARREKLQESLDKLWQNFSKLAETEKNQMTELVFIESIKSQRNDEDFKTNAIGIARSFVEAFDTKEDGFMQEDEYRRLFESAGFVDATSFAKIAFDAIDTNHDGKLSKDEICAAYRDFVLSEDENCPSQFFWGPLE